MQVWITEMRKRTRMLWFKTFALFGFFRSFFGLIWSAPEEYECMDTYRDLWRSFGGKWVRRREGLLRKVLHVREK